MSESTTTTPRAEPDTSALIAALVPDRSVETLQKQVREKDQLVAALTERLEQAAEQLDRLRRTGVDKGHRPLAGAVPAELVQSQKQTLEELKKFIGNWEEIQPGAALGRIESQVTEIRNLIASGAVQSTSPAPAAATAPAARERPASPPAPAAGSSSATATAQKADHSSEGKTSNSSWWERQKAAMLGEGAAPTDEPSAIPASGADSASSPSRGGDSIAASASVSLSDTVIPDLPAPVNFDELTLDDAKQAIRDRDRLIQQLRDPLLLLKAAGQLPPNLESYEHLPPALRQRLDEFEAQWQARFRQAELEMSLERARLAREQSQMQIQQETLTKQAKRGGVAPREPDTVGDDDGNSRRRWFRFMGKSDGAKDSSDEDAS